MTSLGPLPSLLLLKNIFLYNAFSNGNFFRNRGFTEKSVFCEHSLNLPIHNNMPIFNTWLALRFLLAKGLKVGASLLLMPEIWSQNVCFPRCRPVGPLVPYQPRVLLFGVDSTCLTGLSVGTISHNCHRRSRLLVGHSPFNREDRKRT